MKRIGEKGGSSGANLKFLCLLWLKFGVFVWPHLDKKGGATVGPGGANFTVFWPKATFLLPLRVSEPDQNQVF